MSYLTVFFTLFYASYTEHVTLVLSHSASACCCMYDRCILLFTFKQPLKVLFLYVLDENKSAYMFRKKIYSLAVEHCIMVMTKGEGQMFS